MKSWDGSEDFVADFMQPRLGFLDEKGYYGRYCMLWRRTSGGYLLAVGPQWVVALLGLAGVATSLLALCWIFSSGRQWLSVRICAGVGLLALLFYALIIVIDPGIVPAALSIDAALEGHENAVFTCRRCLTPREADAFHCPECDICIEGLDHHCVWAGKCIGRRNVVVFYLLAGSVPLFFGLLAAVGFLSAAGKLHF